MSSLRKIVITCVFGGLIFHVAAMAFAQTAQKAFQETKEKLQDVSSVKAETAEKTKQELEAIRSELGELKTKTAEAADKKAHLEEQLQSKHSKLSELQEQLNTATSAERDALKEEVALVQNAIVELQGKVKEWTEKKSSLDQRIEALAAKEKGYVSYLEKITGQPLTIRSWIEKAVRSGVIFIVLLFFYFALKIGVNKFKSIVTPKDTVAYDDTTLRWQTLSELFNWLITIVIVVMGIYLIMDTFGFDMTPLLAGAGIVGLAFGFGGQYLIRDVISGIFILVEGQFHIGDVIKIGDLAGLVEKVNLRVTRMRDLEGRVIYIPNGEIKSVINYTKEWSRALFEVGVAYKEDIDKVIAVIKDIGKEMRDDAKFGRMILDDLEMLGLDKFGDSAIVVKFFIKTLPIKQWDIMREFNRRLKIKFDELGIEIPFPHRTLYLGTGADNEALKKLIDSRTPS